MSWSPDQVETILAQMQAGATVMSGGSRCHTTYFFADGEYGYEDFDEGHVSVGRSSEAAIRSLIEREPQLFLDVLRDIPWRRFVAAFAAGERAAAREALRATLVFGDRFEHCKILDAVLAWPETPPSAEVVELIREKLRDFTAFHVFMDAAHWQRNREVATRGLAFVDTLVAMVGEDVGIHYLRAAFLEQRGELEAAARELELELERLPAEHLNRSHYESSLARVRGLIAGAPGS